MLLLSMFTCSSDAENIFCPQSEGSFFFCIFWLSHSSCSFFSLQHFCRGKTKIFGCSVSTQSQFLYCTGAVGGSFAVLHVAHAYERWSFDPISTFYFASSARLLVSASFTCAVRVSSAEFYVLTVEVEAPTSTCMYVYSVAC